MKIRTGGRRLFVLLFDGSQEVRGRHKTNHAPAFPHHGSTVELVFDKHPVEIRQRGVRPHRQDRGAHHVFREFDHRLSSSRSALCRGVEFAFDGLRHGAEIARDPSQHVVE